MCLLLITISADISDNERACENTALPAFPVSNKLRQCLQSPHVAAIKLAPGYTQLTGDSAGRCTTDFNWCSWHFNCTELASLCRLCTSLANWVYSVFYVNTHVQASSN